VSGQLYIEPSPRSEITSLRKREQRRSSSQRSMWPRSRERISSTGKSPAAGSFKRPRGARSSTAVVRSKQGSSMAVALRSSYEFQQKTRRMNISLQSLITILNASAWTFQLGEIISYNRVTCIFSSLTSPRWFPALIYLSLSVLQLCLVSDIKQNTCI
jgi:hypothetical protein